MNFQLLHPADQILLIMERIYKYGMTTTSGGNLSILDDNGDIWISPAGIDKGALTRQDIVCVKPDGTVIGNRRPSSEFPFHRLIYKTRPDLKSVVHAHPPALVSFSMVRAIPDTRLLPNEKQICGEIGTAEYALPTSEQLGENIATVFAKGINTVMLENHGVVVGEKSLFEAFKVFETLDFCARLEIIAGQLGRPILLSEKDYETVRVNQEMRAVEFVPREYGTKEKEIRREMCEFIRRSYDQKLFTSTQGTFSHKLGNDCFVITPYDVDRKYMNPEDLVRIEHGEAEAGHIPSRSYKLHRLIYDMHPHVQSIIIAHPPNIMGFAVTDKPFDSRTIPESYILLRKTPKLPFDAVYRNLEDTAKVFKPCTPIAIIKNNCVIATGSSLLQAFDRLEVAEYSAKAVVAAQHLGEIVHIDDQKIKDIETAFHLE